MIYNIAIIGSILFMLFIIFLVRNKKLHEKYSILWLVFAVIILILVWNHQLLDAVANSLGVYYAPALLFLVGFIDCSFKLRTNGIILGSIVELLIFYLEK